MGITALFVATVLTSALAPPAGGGPRGPAERVVKPGETLDGIARDALGDANAAAEIRAFNGLPPGAAVTPGMTLKIPSQSDRKFALSALENVQNASTFLEKTGVPTNLEPKQKDIAAQLDRARGLLSSARYQEVIAVGDSAMALANQLLDAIDKRTVFDVEIRPGNTQDEDTSVFSIHKGTVKVDTPKGSAVLKEGEAGRVKGAMGEVVVEKLADPPQLEAPFGGKTLYSYDVRFAWKLVDNVQEYRLEISRDVRFSNVEVSQVVKGNVTTVNRNLPDGLYYWRVACLTTDGIEGKWSPHSSFAMTYDAEPPELELGKPIWK